MKELVIEPSGSRKKDSQSLAIFHDRHGGNFKHLTDGANYMKLTADLTNAYYNRAILAYINELPVGYLYNDLAVFYQPQILRANDAGFDLVARCHFSSEDREIRFRTLGKNELFKWMDRSLVATGDSQRRLWSALSELYPDAQNDIQSRMTPHILWLASREWFDGLDAPYIEQLCYGLLKYVSKSGVLKGKSLTMQNERCLLAIAYALHRISADDGIYYHGKVSVGNSVSGAEVKVPYIGLVYEDYFRLALEYPDLPDQMAELILTDGRETSHSRVRYRLVQSGVINQYRKNIRL